MKRVSMSTETTSATDVAITNTKIALTDVAATKVAARLILLTRLRSRVSQLIIQMPVAHVPAATPLAKPLI